MKRGKLLMGVLCCLITLLAFSITTYALDFDAEITYDSIFVIYSGDYMGSGFAVGSNTVITNAHVIDDEGNIQIYSYEGENYNASVYLMDSSFDIAVLSVENANFTPLVIGDSEDIKIGDDIYAVGAPESMDYTLTKGVISNKSRKIGLYNYIQIDAAINSGNSGGPLLNSIGEVIGVNSMKMSDAEGIGLAIPIDSVISFMENNGMQLTEEDVVDGTMQYKQTTSENQEAKQNKSENVKVNASNNNMSIYILLICLCLSISLNIVLIIVLIYSKNKNQDRLPDKSERTDFDIDILE